VILLLLSVKEFKNPNVQIQFRFSITKQEVAKRWDEKRRVNEVGFIDLEDVDHIQNCYEEIKPLLFKGYAEDFTDPMTPEMMNAWIRQNAIAFGQMKDKPVRNIWLDLKGCFVLLWEKELLDIDENGILI
jgi:hypothetical protein